MSSQSTIPGTMPDSAASNMPQASSSKTSHPAGPRPFDIKFLAVVNHAKEQGKHTFAVRALGHHGEHLTVYKTYEQYLDLSQRLAADLPHLANRNRLPRLPKKMALFFTRPSIAQREEDLDNWVRCLIEIPDVRAHPALNEFLHDPSTGEKNGVAAPALEVPSRILSQTESSSSQSYTRPNLTLGRSSPSPSRADFFGKALPPIPSSFFAHRPALAHKRSTPNMRHRPSVLDQDVPPTPLPPPHQHFGVGRRSPPSPPSQARPLAPSLRSRPSMDSVARSVSTDHTITPNTMRLSRAFSGRAASPALSPANSPAPSTPASESNGSSERKVPGPVRTLRNFMSLQDLRQNVRPQFTAGQTNFFDVPTMTRSTSSQNSIAANLGHNQNVPTPSSRDSLVEPLDTPVLSPRSLADDHTPVKNDRRKHSDSASSTKSAQSLGFSSSLSSSLSGDTGYDLSLGNSSFTSSMSSNEPSFSFDSGPGSPASMSQPHTPPSPRWIDMPTTSSSSSYKPLELDWSPSDVLTSTLVPLPSNFTFGNDRPFRTRAASRAQPMLKTQLDMDAMPTSPSLAPSPTTPDSSFASSSSYGSSVGGDSVIIKAKHGDEIVMAKVQRGCGLKEVKSAIVDRFQAHKVHLDPSDIQLTRSSKPRAGEPAQMPLRTEDDWKAASASAAKLTLLC